MTIETKVNNIIQGLKDMDLNNKVKTVYKWHNGLVLAKELKKITQDNSFEYVSTSNSNYKFKTENMDEVILDSEGTVLAADMEITPEFEEISHRRLLKTNNMLEAVWS